MADLRHGFSSGTEYRAWPHLAKWCNLEHANERKIWFTIAAGFALKKETMNTGNMGTTLRRLAIENKTNQDEIESVLKNNGRFKRLLTCQSIIELCNHLSGVIRLSEQKNVGINFEKLFWDLVHWEDPKWEIKIKWAAKF